MVSVRSHNDVIQDLDTEEFARCRQALGECTVFRTGSRHTRRMIVDEDRTAGVGQDERCKNLSRVDKACCSRADGYLVANLRSACAVESHDPELFLWRVGQPAEHGLDFQSAVHHQVEAGLNPMADELHFDSSHWSKMVVVALIWTAMS